MDLIFTSIIVATLLLHLEACLDGEYEISGECCPMCGPGYRVSKHCTSSSSTSCLPCTQGTYTDHPHGLTHCFSCRTCDSGSNLTLKERCIYTKNAVCSCASGYYCTHFTNEDCDSCQKHTVAQPGYMVTQAGTETTDTQYVPCPPGTFSTEEMSFSCKPWTNCSESGKKEKKAGTTTSDVVCQKNQSDDTKDSHGHTVPIIITSLFVPLLAVTIGYFCWRRKRKAEITAAAKQEDLLFHEGRLKICNGRIAALPKLKSPEFFNGNQYLYIDSEERDKGYLRVPVPETNMVQPVEETTQKCSKPAYQAV